MDDPHEHLLSITCAKYELTDFDNEIADNNVICRCGDNQGNINVILYLKLQLKST